MKVLSVLGLALVMALAAVPRPALAGFGEPGVRASVFPTPPDPWRHWGVTHPPGIHRHGHDVRGHHVRPPHPRPHHPRPRLHAHPPPVLPRPHQVRPGVVVGPPPTCVWVAGHWAWSGFTWVWVPGHCWR
jgi:hypothetical protein